MNGDGVKLVAIVGRPNVGKSTLFNALLGKTGALTSPVPGTTRDILEGMARIEGLEVTFLDTGGTGVKGSLGEKVEASVETAISRASAVLLIVVTGGSSSEEERRLSRLLHRLQTPVQVICNKCDRPEDDLDAWDSVSLGFGQPIPISALTGRNLPELKRRIAGILASGSSGPGAEDTYGTEGRCIVFGQPNVGKSSLFNAMLGFERSLVHDVPGTTRDPVSARLRLSSGEWELVDTAGISRRWRHDDHVPRESQKMVMGSMKNADIALLVMDLTVPLARHDLRLVRMSTERGLALAVALNKCDLVAQRTLARIRQNAADFLYSRFAELGRFPIVICSAKTGEGLTALSGAIAELKSRRGITVSPETLADIAYGWPTSGRSWRLRQVTTRPPVFMVSPPAGTRHNVRYVANRIREYLGLHGVPIGLRWKDRQP